MFPAEIDDPAFWAAFRQRCRAVRDDAYLVGEVWVTAPEWVAGDRFDALMDYPLAEAILGYVGGASLDMASVASHIEYRDTPASARWTRRSDGGSWSSSASTTRTSSRSSSTCSSSHDTPRALTVLGGDRAALRMAILLQAMLPGAPCIYYGDEVGLSGRERSGQPRRIPMGRGRVGR